MNTIRIAIKRQHTSVRTRETVAKRQGAFIHVRECVTEADFEHISLTTYHEEQRDVLDPTSDPYEVLRYRTLLVAEGLGISEAEAERIVLGKVLA